MNVSDTELVLFAEQQLDPDREMQLLQHAEQDARFAEKLAALRLSRVPYQLAFQVEEQPPLPDALKEDVFDLLHRAASQHRHSG